VKDRLKQRARRLTDRVLLPYFEPQRSELAQLRSDRDRAEPASIDRVDEPVREVPIQLRDFNTLLHELRTVELGRMVRAERILLSVGCSDRSYFDWIERAHGHVSEHWGVELYRPRPDDLPDNARWFAASASHMPDIPDGSVDVVFSGQNFEHLQTDDLVGFLLEARRVLRVGGHVVIDSPNRLATHPLHWRHPEHVVETSPDEAAEVLRLAGFEVTSCRGQWLCIDADGSLLPLMPEPDDVAEVLRRSVLATTAPERSFCWWIEAQRSESAPPVDAVQLRIHVAGLIDSLWDDRVARGAWRAMPGATGLVYRAGPFPVFNGSVVASSDADTATAAGTPLTVRLVGDDGTVLAEGYDEVQLTVAETVFGVWAELHTVAPLGGVLPEHPLRIKPR
jgi:SAM-dependent methyltransferase